METTFSFEIVSPTKRVLSTKVSEVVLPARDGEVGILGGHENFVGLLGTGALKYVSESNDSWLLVSSGTYQILGGKLVVTAEIVEDAKELDVESSRKRVGELEKELTAMSATEPQHAAKQLELSREKARLEVNRRMRLN